MAGADGGITACFMAGGGLAGLAARLCGSGAELACWIRAATDLGGAAGAGLAATGAGLGGGATMATGLGTGGAAGMTGAGAGLGASAMGAGLGAGAWGAGALSAWSSGGAGCS